MIIGNGDIGTALQEVDRKDWIFFASGVSNSQETRQEEYDRERDLLGSQNSNKHLVYFSSLAIFYSNTRYTLHKLAMEDLVRSRFDSYTIVRLGNITWGDNPHTIINFLKDKIKNNKPFKVRDEYRYLIDKQEFLHWMKLLPDWSCEFNITGRMLKVEQIVLEYCQFDPEKIDIIKKTEEGELWIPSTIS